MSDPKSRGDNAPERVADPSSYQHHERAAHPDDLPAGPEPAHVLAAAQAAGADRPAAGPQAIGVAGRAGAVATQGRATPRRSASRRPSRGRSTSTTRPTRT